MGQSLNKSGNYEKRETEIGPVIEECCHKYFFDTTEWSLADFYRAVCLTIEETNRALGCSQFRVPKTSTLKVAYDKHHHGEGKPLTKEEFQKILRELILDAGVTNIGAKDIVFYLFGVPATALFLKQRLVPKLIPNEAFIPAVTSATVFLLAKLNKI